MLYGSPCGYAVALDKMYWCEESKRLISEQVSWGALISASLNLIFLGPIQCTIKEIDSFMSVPDCNQIYKIEQAEMFENKCVALSWLRFHGCTLTRKFFVNAVLAGR